MICICILPRLAAAAADPIEETPPRLEVTPKSRLQRRNERGETPLHVACIRGDIGTAVTLIAQGADVNATDHAGKGTVRHFA